MLSWRARSALCAPPLLTTNYDGLLEEVLRRPTVTWLDREGMREIFRSDSDAIGHLHGFWKSLESVVLTEADYSRVLSDEPSQALETAHYTSKSFLYVGYGDGLADPNFTHLLAWHRKLFPESRNDHFRLCRSADFDRLRTEHSRDDIRVIPYGDDYSDLPAFLSQLRPAEKSSKKNASLGRDAVAYAREAIVEQIRAETVIGDSVDNIDDRELSEITVRPVLLPMPHEQFVNARSMEGGVRPERINPDSVHKQDKILIVAGEELSGVTTALRWIVANAAMHRTRTAPIFVDARNCNVSQRPLDRQVKREAYQHGLIAGRTDELSEYTLAIDNVKPQTTKDYANLISDVLANNAPFIVVGCREGDEGQLVEDLKNTLKPIEIAYLGKLGRGEVQEFARILAPTRPATICDIVMKVVHTERLPRTPFTIALLVVLLSQGASTNTINNSETAVLEQYTNLLLGRSGPFLDPRHDLDPQNREVVLAELAKRFVRERRGASTEAEAILYISEYFLSRDWAESANTALDSFRRMRLLRVEANTVQFQQTSYLHLFAAKAAVRDDEFLNEMLADPLYFAPIIRHYAALVRNSELVVSRMQNLLSEWKPQPSVGQFYGEVEARQVAAAAEDTLEDEDRDADSGETAETEESSEETQFDGHDYDDSSDADRVPFPLDDPASWPEQTRLATTLELASRVLRDSDDLSNLEVKSDLFRLVVSRWGYLAEVLERDKAFDELSVEISEALVKGGLVREAEFEQFSEYFALSLTGFTLYSSLLSTLASRKLIRTYERVRDASDTQEDPYSSIMLALFATNVRTPGWSKDLLAFAAKHGSRWSTNQFMAMIVRVAWAYDLMPEHEAADVRQFLKQAFQSRLSFPDERTRKIRVKEFEQRLLKQRAAGLALRNRNPGDTQPRAISA
jgi:hypothetical protein